MPFIAVYVTYPNLKEAKRISTYLLKKKLIACANIFPIKSVYWWKGKIENSDEFISILKTRKENWKKVREEIQKMHSYEVPCITKQDVSANKEYEDWINKES